MGLGGGGGGGGGGGEDGGDDKDGDGEDEEEEGFYAAADSWDLDSHHSDEGVLGGFSEEEVRECLLVLRARCVFVSAAPALYVQLSRFPTFIRPQALPANQPPPPPSFANSLALPSQRPAVQHSLAVRNSSTNE